MIPVFGRHRPVLAPFDNHTARQRRTANGIRAIGWCSAGAIQRLSDLGRPRQKQGVADVRDDERTPTLPLQLPFSFDVSAAGRSLVSAPPERPGDDMGGLDAPLRELDGDMADFLDRPADQECLVRRRGIVFLGDLTLARWRMAAIMAKTSMTSDTWRCQPCQERVSL